MKSFVFVFVNTDEIDQIASKINCTLMKKMYFPKINYTTINAST